MNVPFKSTDKHEAGDFYLWSGERYASSWKGTLCFVHSIEDGVIKLFDFDNMKVAAITIVLDEELDDTFTKINNVRADIEMQKIILRHKEKKLEHETKIAEYEETIESIEYYRSFL